MTAPTGFHWVETARKELRAEFAPRAERALDTWPVQVSEVTLADIPCQRLLPKGGPPKATLLYFFGGGHVSGSPECDLPITACLCDQARLQVIVPRYALAPEHPFPAALTQAITIWPVICAALDGAPPLLAGESAGGNLALALTRHLMKSGQTPPGRLALLSPWCDMTPEGLALSLGMPEPYLPPDRLAAYADAYLQGQSPSDPRVSPLRAEFWPEWPPTHLTTGTRDALRPTVLALHDRLLAAGVTCTLTDAEDMWHVFEAYDEAPQARASLAAIAGFLSV